MGNTIHTNNGKSSTRLSDAQREQFVQDGYVIVPGLLPPEAVTLVRERLLEVTGQWEDDAVLDGRAAGAQRIGQPCRPNPHRPTMPTKSASA